MDPVHLISYLSSLSADLQQWLTAPHPLPRRAGVRQRRPQVPGRLAARREPPAARRLAAPDRLAAGLSAPQSPLASPVLCSRLQCLPTAAALPTAVAPGPRQPGQSLVAVLPGRASRELDAPPPAAAPPMRDMDGWIVDHWIGIGLRR